MTETEPRGPDDLRELAYVMLAALGDEVPIVSDVPMQPAVQLVKGTQTAILNLPTRLLVKLLSNRNAVHSFYDFLAEQVENMHATAIVIATEISYCEGTTTPGYNPEELIRTMSEEAVKQDDVKGRVQAISVSAESAAGCVWLVQRFERRAGRIVVGNRVEVFFAPHEYGGRSKLFNRQVGVPN
jgi:hypothetical protein